MSSRTSKPARLKECSPLFLRLSTQNCRPKNRLVVSGCGYHRHKMDRLGFLQNVKPQGGKNAGRVFSSCERNQGQVLLHKQLQFEERTENNSWPLKKPYTVWNRIIKRKRGEADNRRARLNLFLNQCITFHFMR